MDFKRLCLWLVNREGYHHTEHLRTSSGEQGRNIQAWKNGKRIIFQSKRVKSFQPQDALEAVDKIIYLPKDKRPKEFIFLVTSDMPVQTRDAARQRSGKIFSVPLEQVLSLMRK